MGPDNIMDQFAMVVVKSETVVWLIMKWKTVIFAKSIFS